MQPPSHPNEVAIRLDLLASRAGFLGWGSSSGMGVGDWAGGVGWGLGGTATLGFGKLIRVQESSEWRERDYICIKPIYIMFFTNCAARRLLGWLAGRGRQ